MNIWSQNMCTKHFITTLFMTYVAWLCIISGILIGRDMINPLWKRGVGPNETEDYLGCTLRSDALNYVNVIDEGYRYHPDHSSNVAFFPAYPMACKLLWRNSPFRKDFTMLFVSNVAAALGAFVLYVYVRRTTITETGKVAFWSLAVYCLWPPTFFLRMPYAESSFCVLLLLALFGMGRRWPIWIVAAIAGLATLTRPVGIAVSVGVWWYAIMPLPGTPHAAIESLQLSRSGVRRRFAALLWVLPLSCWGLLAYMMFLWWKFDTPLAFAQTQAHWNFQAPTQGTLWDKAWSLLTLEPIWGVYDPNSIRFWIRGDEQTNPLLSCLFWNPLFYLASWFLVVLGWRKKWLKGYEILISVCLLLFRTSPAPMKCRWRPTPGSLLS